MSKSILFSSLAVAGIACGAWQQNPSTLLKSHVDKLSAAPSLKVVYTVQPIGGAAEEFTLNLSKPSSLRWESAKMILISDGTTITKYDKAKKTYSQEPASADSNLKTMLDERLWFWSAFFDAKFTEQVSGLRAGKPRRVKAGPVQEVLANVAKRSQPAVSFFVDEKLGVARGGLLKVGSDPTDVLISAEIVEIGTAPAEANLFAFVPPAGATKVEAAAADAVTYAEINRIFMGNCVGCHGAREQRSGLSLATYDGVMKGGRGGKVVEAGNPASSRILNYLRGNGAPVMPPRGGLPTAMIEKIEAWIKAGAKNE